MHSSNVHRKSRCGESFCTCKSCHASDIIGPPCIARAARNGRRGGGPVGGDILKHGLAFRAMPSLKFLCLHGLCPMHARWSHGGAPSAMLQFALLPPDAPACRPSRLMPRLLWAPWTLKGGAARSVRSVHRAASPPRRCLNAGPAALAAGFRGEGRMLLALKPPVSATETAHPRPPSFAGT